MSEKIVDIQTLVQDDHNFNKGTEAGRQLMERSFSELGAGRSILVDKDGRIIAGNKSQKAAIAAGIKKVRIIETTGDELVAVKRTDISLDSKEGRELALADNLTTQVNLEWDKVELQEVAAQQGIDLPDWGLDPQALGIDEQPAEPQEAQEDDFDEEKDGIEQRAAVGDVWILGEHRLVCGDSTDKANIDKLLNGEKASMIFTDPPYGMGLNTDYSSLSFNGRKGIKWEQGAVDDFDPAMLKIIFDLDVKETFLWGADYYIEHIPNRKDGSWIVWDKTLESNGDAGSNSEFELCWSKQKHKRKVIHFNWFRFFGLSKQDAKKRLHPTQKPLQVISPFLTKYSKEQDIVLDLFGGSGSTLIACEQLNRKARLMELDPHYCDVIIARWEKLTGLKATRL